MNDGHWRFSVTAPDWGQDHLSSDAIVAFVDGELSCGPQARATQHLAQCPECAAQVVVQGQARSALRSAGCPIPPSSLLGSLRSIPQNVDLPPPPPGLAVTGDGQLVSVLRPEREGVPTADLAAGGAGGVSGTACVDTSPLAHSRLSHNRRPLVQRRIRFGAGAAVSGLALGALALGAAASSAPVAAVPPTVDRGVLGGPVLAGTSGVVEARLRLSPVTSGAHPDDLVLDHRFPGAPLRLR